MDTPPDRRFLCSNRWRGWRWELRLLAAAAAMVIVASSCSAETATTSEASSTVSASTVSASTVTASTVIATRPPSTTPPGWLGHVVDSTLRGSVSVPVGDGALVYGGVAADGTINRYGVFLDPDGRYRPFRTDVGLVDATSAVTDSAVYLAGRSCAGEADDTDTGFVCTPGIFVTLRVDRTSAQVTDVDLGVDAADRTGQLGGISLYPFGDRLAVVVPTSKGATLVAIADDGTTTELSRPGGNLLCSTGSTLFAEAEPPAPVPREVMTDETPVEIHKPGIVAMGVGDTTWTPVAQPHRAPLGIRDCSKGHFFELPTGSVGAQTIAIFDTVTRRWKVSKDVALGFTPYPLVNPATAHFVVVGDTYHLIDPSTAEPRLLPSPPIDPLAGTPRRVLSSDLRVLSIGADLHLEPME